MRRLVAAISVLAVMLTACTGDEAEPEPTADATAVTDATEAPDVEDGATTPAETEAVGEPGPGVDGNTVSIVFHRQESSCAETPEGTAPSQEFLDKGARIIDGYVTFMNEEVLADAGWQLDYQIVDDGGQFCPELQTAAARRITQEIQPFAVLGSSGSVQGPIIADAVTAEGILHLGGNFSTYEALQERHPYAWVTGALPMRGLEGLMGFIEKRVLGTTVEDRTGGGGQVDRVWGILAQDDEAGAAYAQFAEDRLTDMGVEVAGTYTFPADPGVAAQQATTRVTQMVEDGVNSLVWAVDYDTAEASWAVTAAMAEQEFLPDILTGTTGVAFLDSLQNQTVWANAYGVATGALVALLHGVEIVDGATQTIDVLQGVPENEDGYIQVWQDRLGNASDPQEAAVPSGYAAWQQLSHLALALLNLEGDTLNAETYAQSMDSAAFLDSPNRCSMARLMGRDEPQAANLSWSSEHNGGNTQMTTAYWVNEPRPEVGVQGHWESFDNYVYYPNSEDIPNEPTHDTGEIGREINAIEPIGLAPWVPCSEIEGYPGYDLSEYPGVE